MTPKRSVARWFVFAMLSIFWWGIFGFLSKLGSDKISPLQMQVFFTVGMIPLAVGAVLRRRLKVEMDLKGALYGISNGALTGLGMVAFFGAMERGPASIVAPVTSLFPVLTAILAVSFLKERMNRLQTLGIIFAVTSIFILSI